MRGLLKNQMFSKKTLNLVEIDKKNKSVIQKSKTLSKLN